MSDESMVFKLPAAANFEVRYYLSDADEVYPSRVFPPHIHDVLEVYLLIEGDASFMVENNVYALFPGDAVISKPNEIHNCILNSPSRHRHACLWFDASDFFVSALCNHDFGSDNLISPPSKDKEELIQAVKQAFEAHKEGKKLHEFSLLTRVLDILSSSAKSAEPLPAAPEVLLKILGDVNENFRTIESVESLAEKYYVSHSTLCRMFREYLHTSPQMYLQTKRLAYSRVLLKEGASVSAACQQAGFSDYSNYIRLFRTRFGVTPNKYKQE